MSLIGKSKTVSEAKKLVDSIRHKLNNYKPDIEFTTKVIDWGGNRGQGRRSGSIVKGSMSNAPTGEKEYTCVDNSKYVKDSNGDFKYFDGSNSFRYQVARKYGCNHIEARYYAIKYD